VAKKKVRVKVKQEPKDDQVPMGATTLTIMALFVTFSILVLSIVIHYAECRGYLNVILSAVAPADVIRLLIFVN